MLRQSPVVEEWFLDGDRAIPLAVGEILGEQQRCLQGLTRLPGARERIAIGLSLKFAQTQQSVLGSILPFDVAALAV